MKGLPLSPGMRSRIQSGLYAFPPEEWDIVSQDAKNVIRNLLRTDPATRTQINDLMKSHFIQQTENLALDSIGMSPASSDSGCAEDSSDEPSSPETPDALAELNMPKVVRKNAARLMNPHTMSARVMNRPAKPPRLNSIQVRIF